MRAGGPVPACCCQLTRPHGVPSVRGVLPDGQRSGGRSSRCCRCVLRVGPPLHCRFPPSPLPPALKAALNPQRALQRLLQRRLWMLGGCSPVAAVTRAIPSRRAATERRAHPEALCHHHQASHKVETALKSWHGQSKASNQPGAPKFFTMPICCKSARWAVRLEVTSVGQCGRV